MRPVLLMLAFALLAARPAAAQDILPIILAPGESVTIRFDDGGRVGEPVRGRAAWSRFDVFAAQQLTGQTPPDAPIPVGTPFTAPEGIQHDPLPPNEVRLRFHSIADRHALLVVENGQGRALAYRARMTVRGEARATDVCVVLPHLPSYEHWPHTIERLELSHFRFIPWAPGRAPACA